MKLPLNIREEILESSIKELKVLAQKAGKTLTEKTIKNLFIRKKAYQKDWVQQSFRRKATLIAGATVIAIGTPEEEELKKYLS